MRKVRTTFILDCGRSGKRKSDLRFGLLIVVGDQVLKYRIHAVADAGQVTACCIGGGGLIVLSLPFRKPGCFRGGLERKADRRRLQVASPRFWRKARAKG